MEMEIVPGVEELPKVTVLEQTSDSIVSRSEYSNGLIMITKMLHDQVYVSTNYKMIEFEPGKFKPDFDNMNEIFIDSI